MAHETIGGGNQTLLLAPVHKIFRIPVSHVVSGLHFTEKEKFIVFGNDVHFQVMEAPVSFQNVEMPGFQVTCGFILSGKAGLSV